MTPDLIIHTIPITKPSPNRSLLSSHSHFTHMLFFLLHLLFLPFPLVSNPLPIFFTQDHNQNYENTSTKRQPHPTRPTPTDATPTPSPYLPVYRYCTSATSWWRSCDWRDRKGGGKLRKSLPGLLLHCSTPRHFALPPPIPSHPLSSNLSIHQDRLS